jgi:prepilin-type N-terminal cleavage/methylation domain-containing protein
LDVQIADILAPSRLSSILREQIVWRACEQQMSRKIGHCRRGFTLVELLVVVAIIVVLLSILVPTLSHAKARANEVACATTLRGWGTAFHNYATDWNVFPHTSDHLSNPSGAQNSSYPYPPWIYNDSSYIYVLPPLMGDKSWADYPLGQKPTAGIFQCPLAVAGAPITYSFDIVNNGYHSYAANQYLDGAKSEFLLPARVVTPSATLLMFESTLFLADTAGQTGNTGASCTAGEYCADNPEALGDRHPHAANRLGGNLLFIDAHLEWTDHLWDPTLPNPRLPPTTNQLWWPN